LARMRRSDLIAEARNLGVHHPELMTRVELTDEILRLTEPTAPAGRGTRGWLGVARDLLARLVERGLNLPSAAALIRGYPDADVSSHLAPPVATVTLAEIYAAQGHAERAVRMLDDVLEKEPDHEPARRLRERLRRQCALAEPCPAPRASSSQVPAVDTPQAAVVALADHGQSIYVYWEIGSETVDRLRRVEPTGQAVVRVLSSLPCWEGAQQAEQELAVEPPSGGMRVDVTEPGAVVRAVLGWRSPSGFRPLAIGTALTSAGAPVGSWAPPRPTEQQRLAVEQRARAAYLAR
jgi:hypothetical protein